MKNVIFILTLSALIIACNGTAMINEEHLLGKWSLYEAERDGKSTLSLQGVFFDFSDEEVETNFPIQGLGETYRFESNKIHIEGEDDLTFNVNSLNEDSLVVDLSYLNSTFKLKLQKAQD